MLASMFVYGGINAVRHPEPLAVRAKPVTDRVTALLEQVAPQLPVPTDGPTMVRLNGAVHIGAGLALATGRAPRLAALVLAATMPATTAGGHAFWRESDPTIRRQQTTNFLKNVSMTGGLLLAAVDTEGRPGLAWRARHATRDVRRQAKHLKREAKLAVK